MYKKIIKRGESKKFDYYIYLDYSENLIGYTIIEESKVGDLIPKISRFRHYRGSKNRKIYLKHIHNTIKKEDIYSYFVKLKIKKLSENIEIYVDILEFIREHKRCIIFISIDDKQYLKFRKLVHIVDGKRTKIVKESELKKGTKEYQMSLVIDNLLNIKRRQYRNRVSKPV